MQRWTTAYERSRAGFCLVYNCFVIVHGKKSSTDLRTIQWGKIDFDKAFMTLLQFSSLYRLFSQVIGRLFAPSQKLKKWTQPFRQCFELVFGILNAPRKIFLAVYEPILKLQGLEGVGFQGKNCLTKMVSNFSKIDCGFK